MACYLFIETADELLTLLSILKGPPCGLIIQLRGPYKHHDAIRRLQLNSVQLFITNYTTFPI